MSAEAPSGGAYSGFDGAHAKALERAVGMRSSARTIVLTIVRDGETVTAGRNDDGCGIAPPLRIRRYLQPIGQRRELRAVHFVCEMPSP